MSGENAPEATETTATTGENAAEVVETKKTLDQLSQEELVDYVKTLRKENASHRTEKQAKAKELEEFQAWKDSQKSELEKVTEKATKLEKENYSLLKTSIALGAGLSMDDVDFISGDTPEDMKASAEKLAGRLKPAESGQTAGVTDVFAGNRGLPTSATPGDAKEIANRYMSQLIWGSGN